MSKKAGFKPFFSALIRGAGGRRTANRVDTYIIFAGNADQYNPKDKQHAHEMGAVDYIKKPYDKDDLLRRVGRILNK